MSSLDITIELVETLRNKAKLEDEATDHQYHLYFIGKEDAYEELIEILKKVNK